jgi:hypothetical protein
MAAALARHSYPPELAPTIERLCRASEVVFAAIAPTQATAPSSSARWKQWDTRKSTVSSTPPTSPAAPSNGRGTAEQLGEHLVSTKLISAEDLARFLALSDARATQYTPRRWPAPGTDDAAD